MELIACTERYGRSNFLVPDYDFNYVSCINATQFTIGGDYFSEVFDYLSIKFKRCSSQSNPYEQRIACDGDDLVEANLRAIGFSVGMSEFIVDPSKHNLDPPLLYKMKTMTMFPSSKFRQNTDIFYTTNIISSFENLFARYFESTIFYFIEVSKVNPTMELMSVDDPTYIALVIRSDSFYTHYFRVYKSFFKLISQIGGIWKILLMLGGILIYPLNRKFQKISLTNESFNLIDPSKDLSGEKFENYRKDIVTSNPKLLLKVENVTGLEAQACIDYYKYERCKGLSYSLSDTIRNFLFIPSELTKLKNSIFDLAELKLNSKLAISNIFLFVQQVEAIKQIIFRDLRLFIEYSQETVVHFNNLELISIKYQICKYDQNATSLLLSIIKTIKFIKGVRAIKNKSVLDTKIDINLIKRYNLSSFFLRRYFMSHTYALSKHVDIGEKTVRKD